MKTKLSKFFYLETPNGIFYCATMDAVYSILSEDYPSIVRSRKLRLGSKEIGDIRQLELKDGGKIILRVLPLYKMEGRQNKPKSEELEPKK